MRKRIDGDTSISARGAAFFSGGFGAGACAGARSGGLRFAAGGAASVLIGMLRSAVPD
jgi:hypothetical protein